MQQLQKKNLKHLSDEQLLTMVADRVAGWQSAFTQLTARYCVYLRHYCQCRLPQPADVEDVVQEVFFSVFRYASQFRHEAAFKTWLTRIAHNQCHAFRTKQQKYCLVDHIQELVELHQVELQTGDDELQRAELQHDVSQVIARLGGLQREVLSLRYWDDLSVKDISKTLDVGLSTAKMRIRRAVCECAELYAADDLIAA